MLVILLLILLLIALSGQSTMKQVEIDTDNDKEKEAENIIVEQPKVVIEKKEPTGLEEDSHWANYNQSAIPKIPYRTNRDIVAPPKIAVEINCPECPDNWE